MSKHITWHSPPPWFYKQGEIYCINPSDGDERVIGQIGKSRSIPSRQSQYEVVTAGSREGRANAALITAAPDLLNTLLTFVIKLYNGVQITESELREAAQLAIKARTPV